MNAKPQVTLIDRPKLALPNGADKLLLHSCCAPCSGEVMEALLASDIDYTIYFYNPNIHPLKEYEIRKNENIRFANDCGHRAAAHYPGIVYWDFNWRKGGGSARMIEISKREHFYQQEYCGCAYSLRDTNAWRREKGREPIKIGVKYYGDDDDE